MDDPKQKVIDSLKQANNILVTVRNSPSIDQLAACIALTLIINELDKHGTAVFSGQVPSVLEFLEPDKTIERNTDSLRDFIISLDKAKADKLRYKVEDTVVKIFITPYRTSLSSDDLEFGQGDFNVDVVVALGVHNQNDLDEAITAHGRILHDATVISINIEGGPSEDLGSINWIDGNVSSLSEMIFGVADKLGKENVIDNQIATALLTGIVAETGRFSNAKTKPETMEVAAKLLTAGANQELVATKLSEPPKPEEPPHDEGGQSGGDSGPVGDNVVVANDANGGGELAIEHPEHTDSPGVQSLVPSQPDSASDSGPSLPTEPTDSFAKEDTAFSVPQQPETADHRDDGQKTMTGDDTDGRVPPVFDPNQMGAAGNEEQEALDFLKERKVEIGDRAKIEPLHSQDEILSAPRIVAEPAKSEAQAPGDEKNDPHNRFALTPPSLGGTLTANLPDGHDMASVESMLEKQKSSSPMLSHRGSSVLGSEANHDEESSSKAASVSPALDAAPLPAGEAPVKSSSEPAKPLTTLEDLEKQVHAHEAADVSVGNRANYPILQAVPQGPPSAPEGAKDMPAPPTVKLPTPQSVSPTGSSSPTPLAPPPPVPPPLPHS